MIRMARLAAAFPCGLWLLLVVGCNSRGPATTTAESTPADVMNGDYSDALGELEASWPATVTEATAALERMGYQHQGVENPPHGTATSYVHKDSTGEINLLVNVDRRFASASYTPSGHMEVTEELVRELKEKCTSSSFWPPGEFEFHFEASVSDTDSFVWVTDVGITLPRGVWKYSTTRLQLKRRGS